MRSAVLRGVLLALIVSGVIAGCATGRYGDIVIDGPTTKAFDAFALDPGMNYYYSGPDLYPNVIVGLKKAYVIAPDTWKPLQAEPALFRDAIRHMQEKALEYGQLLHGFLMKTPDGKVVGVWYSIPRAKQFIQQGQDNIIIVYPPPLEIFERDREGGRMRFR